LVFKVLFFGDIFISAALHVNKKSPKRSLKKKKKTSIIYVFPVLYHFKMNIYIFLRLFVCYKILLTYFGEHGRILGFLIRPNRIQIIRKVTKDDLKKKNDIHTMFFLFDIVLNKYILFLRLFF